MYHTGTIAQTHAQLAANGHCISTNTLRAWVKQGILPAAYNGKKAYISYDNVIAILENGTPPSAVGDISSGGIRKIS